ncbi:hypothetical protein [Halomonas sp. DWK9]|uniref:hypothetical protein n=1 Tax=Halomonas sp. DWK9 TaxID=3060155 RepID=UPI00287F6ADA|nr:hypothetical protein [Halomonas sp. DWK9]
MSLAVYIGTENFRDEREGDAQEPSNHNVSLSDIATGLPINGSEEQPQLLLSGVTEEALAALEHWLKTDAERTCTLAWPHPSAWLAASLQQGSRPKEALWQWSHQADLIQKLYKRKRRQVTLEGYVPNATTVAELPLVAQLTLNGIAPIYRLMAHQLTQENSLLQQAYSYLKASSAHAAAWQLPAVEAVEQSLHHLAQEHHQRDAKHSELNQAQQENAKLTEQLAKLQQQHKEAQANNEANQKQLKETTERLSEKSAQLLETEKTKDTLNEQLTQAQEASAKQSREHAKLQDHTHSIEQENAALLEQLMTVQEALEENILANQAHQTDLEEKEVKLNWLRKKTKSQEAKLEERKTALSQLKDEHKSAMAALEKALAEQKKETQAQQTAYQTLSKQAEQKEQALTKAHQEAVKQAEQKEKALTKSHQEALEKAEHAAGSAQQKAQRKQEQLLQEQALVMEQLHETQEQLNQQLNETLSLQQAHSKLQKQHASIEQQAIQSNQLLEKEAIEKSLIVAQLHEAQEQLVKNTENADYYKKQADSRQKTINVLKQEQQLIRHQYESINQWLRVSGHRNAAAAYRYSRPFKRALPQQLAMIKESGFFDAQWYCEQYPDVKTAGIEPAEHYLKFGAIEGRNPSDKFDTHFYLCEYPDVAISGQNPLLHYLRYGQHEERFPIQPRQQLPAPVQP